jgi:hypothetical protein
LWGGVGWAGVLDFFFIQMHANLFVLTFDSI